MALSTLKVNQITPRANVDEIKLGGDLNLDSNDIESVGTITAQTYSGGTATTTAPGLMSNTDKLKLNAIEASADVTDATNVDAAGALMDSDFNGGNLPSAGVLYKTQTNTYTVVDDVFRSSSVNTGGFVTVTVDGNTGETSFVVDGNTYLTGNESISLSSDVTGTGSTGITCTLTANAITGKSLTTTVDDENDRILIAKQVAGNYQLRQLKPKDFTGGSSTGGITGVQGHVLTTYTTSGVTNVEAQTDIISSQSELSDTDISTSQTSLFAYHGIDNKLKQIKFQEVLDWANANVSSGGGSGGSGGTTNIVGGIIQMFIQVSDGHLILEHTGAFTSNTIFIQASDNHLILSS